MAALIQDLRYALRQLLKSPGFTTAAVLSLALGIGANTAVFSVVNATLLRPLPIHEPERVVRLWHRSANSHVRTSFGYPEFVELRSQSAALVEVAASADVTVDLSTSTGSVRIPGALVSGNYFKTLGVSPVLGRGFLPEEDRTPSENAVVVISHRCWKRQLNSDAGVIGKTVKLNGREFTIVGVAPPGFTGTVIGSEPEVWAPLMMWAGIQELPAPLRKLNFDPLRSNGYGWLSLVGRLRPAVGIEAVRQRLNGLYARVTAASEPGLGSRLDLTLLNKTRLPQRYEDSMILMMRVLFAVVGVLLLIACANVASLLMGRAVARKKEIATRLALGAQRGRVVFELLAESIVLAILGGGAGTLLALWSMAAVEAWRPLLRVPVPMDITLDFRVLGFTLVVSVVSGCAVGLATALRATRAAPAGALKELRSAAVTDRGVLSPRNLLVVGQIALSFLLLISAGLLLRTLLNLQSIEVGFDPHNLILLKVDFVRHGYPEASAAAAYPHLLEQIQRLPGVESASLAQYVPLTGSGSAWTFDAPTKEAVQIDQNVVAPGYFQTMRIPMLRGRDFTPQDRAGAQRVTIVDEAFARLWFHGSDSIGRTAFGMIVVGLVRDTKNDSLRRSVEPRCFVPFAQNPESRMSMVIRTSGDPGAVLKAVRRTALALDPEMPASSVCLMTDQLRGLLWQPHITALLVGAFALLATLLALLGVYSAVSFEVTRRTQEIGIRMALGARQSEVLRLVLQRGISLALAGLAIGLAAASAASRLLTSLLYGVSPLDPAVFALVPPFLAAVVLVACYIPARRASKVDPIIALRYE